MDISVDMVGFTAVVHFCRGVDFAADQTGIPSPALAGIADNIHSFRANTGMLLENVVRYEYDKKKTKEMKTWQNSRI